MLSNSREKVSIFFQITSSGAQKHGFVSSSCRREAATDDIGAHHQTPGHEKSRTLPGHHLVKREVQEQLWQGLAESGASGAPKHHAQAYGLTPKRTSGFIKKQGDTLR